uniref:Glycerophosphoryl diester phosphodiesterase membrane domain-containing protein n=1 Tax=candidate division WOR-3 bacterium TaxID=2052148 RepID=A0A7V3ZY39_UNCW3
MRANLSYSYKDVWNSIKYSFSFKKLWTQLQGLILGVFIYSIFSYLALLLSGYSIKEIWNYWKFVPIPVGEPLSVWGWILLIIGIAGLLVFTYIYAVAVAKITVEQLKGDEFYEVKDAVIYARKKGWPVITTPLSILFVILFILLCGVVLGLLGKIPYLGEIILLISAIPAIVMCFFLVYLFFAFVISLILPVSVVSLQESDTFDTLFEVFSTLNEQPFRFLLYQLYVIISAVFTSSLFAWALGRAVWIMDKVLSASWLMGSKFKAIEEAALYFFTTSPLFGSLYSYLKFLGIHKILSVPSVLPAEGGLVNLVGFFFGIGLYIMVFLVIAQVLNSLNVGTLLSYLVIVKKKDDLDLLEVKKEEEKMEETGSQPSGGGEGN